MESSFYLNMAAAEERHWSFAGRRSIISAIMQRMPLKPGATILELGSLLKAFISYAMLILTYHRPNNGTRVFR